MGGSASKRKGTGFEREVVAALRAAGVVADRVPLSGAAGGEFSGDVRLTIDGHQRTAECKRRKRSFGFIDQSLGENFVLFCRDDNGRILVVTDVRDFVQLAKGYHEHQG